MAECQVLLKSGKRKGQPCGKKNCKAHDRPWDVEKKGTVVLDIETTPITCGWIVQEPGKTIADYPLEIRVAVVYSYDDNQYHTFWKEDSEEFFAMVSDADRVVTYNGEGFDFDVMRVNGFDGKITESVDICDLLYKYTGKRDSLDSRARAVLGKKKQKKGRQMIEADGEALAEACRIDVELTKELYEKPGSFKKKEVYPDWYEYRYNSWHPEFTETEGLVYNALRLSREYTDEWMKWAIDHMAKVVFNGRLAWIPNKYHKHVVNAVSLETGREKNRRVIQNSMKQVNNLHALNTKVIPMLSKLDDGYIVNGIIPREIIKEIIANKNRRKPNVTIWQFLEERIDDYREHLPLLNRMIPTDMSIADFREAAYELFDDIEYWYNNYSYITLGQYAASRSDIPQAFREVELPENFELIQEWDFFKTAVVSNYWIWNSAGVTVEEYIAMSKGKRTQWMSYMKWLKLDWESIPRDFKYNGYIAPTLEDKKRWQNIHPKYHTVRYEISESKMKAFFADDAPEQWKYLAAGILRGMENGTILYAYEHEKKTLHKYLMTKQGKGFNGGYERYRATHHVWGEEESVVCAATRCRRDVKAGYVCPYHKTTSYGLDYDWYKPTAAEYYEENKGKVRLKCKGTKVNGDPCVQPVSTPGYCQYHKSQDETFVSEN